MKFESTPQQILNDLLFWTMTDDVSDSPITVQFDVGGKVFKTARSLFRQVEDTMLARLVCDTWLEDPTKPVFIDRNGDTFGLVLDYLRYGSIDLPITVSKEMFLRDLDFYGIVPNDGTVKACSEDWADQVDKRHDDIENIEKAKAVLEAKRRHLELSNHIDLLVLHCASEYLSGSSVLDLYCPTATNAMNEEKLWGAAMAVCMTSKVTFQKSISKFGLRLKDIKIHGNRCTILLDKL